MFPRARVEISAGLSWIFAWFLLPGIKRAIYYRGSIFFCLPLGLYIFLPVGAGVVLIVVAMAFQRAWLQEHGNPYGWGEELASQRYP